MTPTRPRVGRGRRSAADAGKFDKLITDSERISTDEAHGLLTQILKDRLFNGVRYVRGGQSGLDQQLPDHGMNVVDG